jgi:cell wall-associated protease
MVNLLKFVFLFFLIIGCSSNKMFDAGKINERPVINNFSEISLDNWYAENRSKKTKNEIIVAVLDSQIDLNHEDLKGQIWTNKKEIPNNNLDDDRNGYVDDVNGWNFIGLENDKTLVYSNFELVRVINEFKDQFEDQSNINENNIFYKEYLRAIEKLKIEKKYYSDFLRFESMLIAAYYPAKDSLKKFFPKEDYSIAQLDSLYQLTKKNDKTFYDRFLENDTSRELPDLIVYMKTFKQVDYTIEKITKSKAHYDSIVNKILNLDYNDREKIKRIADLEEGYGNNNLNSHDLLRRHSTEVSSIIAANRKNKVGTSGFHDSIKIMPLNISPFGNEHDKDISMAIYYAVDNGAKVINMSFGKEFSLKQNLVTEAFKYAEKNNVLVVHSSGNEKYTIDQNPFYPADVDYLLNENIELVDNFINVASISKRTDSTMVSSFSNYGKQNVDIFAPGEEIYVALPDNQYRFDSGTSLAAPMVSGTAALIWLYYPELTVQEVKKIILESGVTIDKMVVKPGTTTEMVHFSELCKSGKILNTYNAMKMAEKISKEKN